MDFICKHNETLHVFSSTECLGGFVSDSAVLAMFMLLPKASYRKAAPPKPYYGAFQTARNVFHKNMFGDEMIGYLILTNAQTQS